MNSVTLIASLENERFKGGIFTIAQGILKRKDLFKNQGYKIRGVSSCQKKARNIENVGKFKLENILNVWYVLRAIHINEKTDKSSLFYGITSTGLGFFKDVFVFSLLKIRWPRKQTVLNVQFTDIEKILPINRLFKSLSIFLVKKYIDELVVPNTETGNDFISIGYPRRVSVLSNFFVQNEIEIKGKDKMEDSNLKLLYLGMIDERKGFDKVLRLLNELEQDKVELHVCGEYLSLDFKKKMEAYIERNNLANRIFFHGFVTGEVKQKIVSSCDVLMLLTSGEGMAMALLEGMSSGLSVITTEITSNKEVFDKADFSLFDANDEIGMLNVLNSYSMDGVRLNEDKEICKEVVQRFTIESHIDSLVDIFRKQEVC